MGIREWRAGAIVEERVGVRNLRLNPYGAKGPQFLVTLFDATGERTGKGWRLSPDELALLREAASADVPILTVKGRVEGAGNHAEEVTVDAVAAVPFDDVNDDDFLTPLPLDHAQLVTGLDCLIGSVRDPFLSQVLTRTIGPEGKLRDRFLRAVAAQRNHHAHPGGLLRHSLEVAEFALATPRRFPGINRDLLLTAALLHDIGKLWEMDHGWRQGEFTRKGTLLGHVFHGAEQISALCRTLRFPDGLRDELIHAILAHHDELEYGSPKRPVTAEAIALAKSDQLSAELAAFYEALADATPDQDQANRGGRWFYFGERRAANVPPADRWNDPDPEERLLRRLDGGASEFPGGVLRLPILGVVAAGDGVQSAPEETDPETRPILLPDGGADFLLRVTGDSMTGAGIQEGDLLLVRRQETARPGQIVIAHAPGHGSVVKRLTETASGRFLASENPAYAPIPVTDGVTVQGVVVRLERAF